MEMNMNKNTHTHTYIYIYICYTLKLTQHWKKTNKNKKFRYFPLAKLKRANFWTSFKKVKASYALQSAWNSLCLKWIVIRSGLKFHIKFMEFYFKSIWVKEVMSLIPPHPTPPTSLSLYPCLPPSVHSILIQLPLHHAPLTVPDT